MHCRASRYEKRIIELAGLPAAGKTAAMERLLGNLANNVAARRTDFPPWYRRHLFLGLWFRHARRWYDLYRRLRTCLPRKIARRRVRMYVKQLWRRREQIRSRRIDIIIEDESFATYFARDLDRCDAVADWIDRNADLFYPQRVHHVCTEFLLVVLEIRELVRVHGMYRRGLDNGPVHDRGIRTGEPTHASRRAALVHVNRILEDRKLAEVIRDVRHQAALGSDPSAPTPP